MGDKIITYTPAELTEILHIGITTVYKMLKNGQIPSKKIGKKYVITQQTLEDLINPAKSVNKKT